MTARRMNRVNDLMKEEGAWRRILFRAGAGIVLFLAASLALGMSSQVARASVDLLYFIAEQGSGQIVLYWETGSEMNNAGFYVNRRQGLAEFQRISPLIPPVAEGINGAHYQYPDQDVITGTTYTYLLEILDSAGGAPQFSVPVTVTFGVTASTPTATATVTPTATLPPTLTPSPTATATGSTATSSPSATSTLTLTWTASPTRTITRTPTVTPRRTATRTPTFRFPTATRRVFTPTRVLSPTATVTLTPTETETPTQTATFRPLPRLTLIFPVLSPTGTATRTPTLTPTDTPPPGVLSGEPNRPSLLMTLLGGAIVLAWVGLVGFMVIYLRRLGY